MSIFKPLELSCPNCGKAVSFNGVISVNADRRADLRDAILAESFQRTSCPQCGETFRVDPDFSYIHADRGQWVAAMSLASLADWAEKEERAKASFAVVYGPQASPMLQAMGRKMKPRLTFGWAALREKLLIVDQGLDDVTVELCKAAVLRGREESPVSATTELRLVAVDAATGALVFAWILVSTEAVGELLGLERSVYDEVAADADGGWASLRAGVDAGYFVDLNRIMIPAKPREAAVA